MPYLNTTMIKVEEFIRQVKVTNISEILRLGEDKRVINQDSLNEILAELEKQDKVNIKKMPGTVIVLWKEWFGN